MSGPTSGLVLFASDHRGLDLRKFLVDSLDEAGIFASKDLSKASGKDSIDYTKVAYNFASEFKRSKEEHPELNLKGVLICGTGVGISIAANRFHFIRAALCANKETATFAREHNDANVIVFGANMIIEDQALACMETFLSTPFSNEDRHKRRVGDLSNFGG